MAEHSASIIINAPVHQVYVLFTHFQDFPKFMRFVKEVTYLDTDEQRTHWVAHVLTDYEWDAVNEDWIPDQQIGWRSTSGLQNTGKVKFRTLAPQRTAVDVYISYVPPSGALGQLGEAFGAGSYFDTILTEDLEHFAQMVEQAPEGALDPMSSHYLFHPNSAASLKVITSRQTNAWAHDPQMQPGALAERQVRIAREAHVRETAEQARVEAEKQRRRQAQLAEQVQRAVLEREATRRLQEQQEHEADLAQIQATPRPLDPVFDTLGGRNASKDRTAFGDRDGLRPRHPDYEKSPMMARYPFKAKGTVKLSEEELKTDSPWLHSIRGNPERPPAE
jgi:ribosome-associated toxin RatA of RatAB toxin-antitoxin module